LISAPRDDISRGLVKRAIWKRPGFNLFIAYFARAVNMLLPFKRGQITCYCPRKVLLPRRHHIFQHWIKKNKINFPHRHHAYRYEWSISAFETPTNLSSLNVNIFQTTIDRWTEVTSWSSREAWYRVIRVLPRWQISLWHFYVQKQWLQICEFHTNRPFDPYKSPEKGSKKSIFQINIFISWCMLIHVITYLCVITSIPEGFSPSVDIGRGMITIPIWKKACINLFITYFNIEFKRTKLSSHTDTKHMDMSDRYRLRVLLPKHQHIYFLMYVNTCYHIFMCNNVNFAHT
jgi:hypothetical protein